VWVEGQQVPDLEVRPVGPGIRLMFADGILGWDFLQRFDLIDYDAETGWLTLVDP